MMWMIRRYLPDIFIVGLLLLLPLILFWPQTVGGKTLIPTENLYQYEPYATYREVVKAPDLPHNHLVSDLVLQNYQWKSFIRQSMDDGEIPLWNPHQFSGIPFLAAGQQSTLYPLSTLYYTLPLTSAYGWFTVLNLWLAGAFMYAYMRGLGVATVGGAIAAITYQLCGFFIASAVFPMIIGAAVWLPLLLLMTEFIIQQKPLLGRQSSAPWVVIGAAALGANMLAGHVEITIYTLLILAYTSAARLAWEWWKSRKLGDPIGVVVKSGAWIGVMVALGIGTAVIQYIPLFEVVNDNWRAERTDINTVLGYAHPLRDVVQFALPNFYGSPAHHSYFDLFTGDTITELTNAAGQPINFIDWGIKNYVEGALYLGILPLALAVFGVFDAVVNKRRVEARHAVPLQYQFIFALLTLVSLTFMFGLPTYRLIYLLPGINQLNSPFRWIFGVTVGVAVLAGFGADALSKMVAEDTRRWARRFGVGLVIASITILGGLLLSRLFFGSIEPALQRMVDSMVKADEAFADARMFYSYQFKNILIFGLMTLGSGLVFLLSTKSPVGARHVVPNDEQHPKPRRIPPHRPWVILAIALTAIDLMIASWGFNPASDPLLLDFTPPSIEWLMGQQTENGPFRYMTLDSLEQGHNQLLWPNMTMRYGLDDVRGYDSIISAQYVDYMRDTARQDQLDYNRIAPLTTDQLDTIDWHRLNLLNVRYIVAHKDVVLPENLTTSSDPHRFAPQLDKVYEDEVVSIYQNAGALNRFFFVEQLVDYGQAPLIGEDAIFGMYCENCAITRDAGREKFIDFDLNGPQTRWLVVSETYAPGWRAFIRPQGADDDMEKPLDVQLALENLQGVRLNPLELSDLYDKDDLTEEQALAVAEGRFTIRLVYSPTTFQVGLFGSIISTALLMFLFGVWLWRLLVGESNENSTAVSRVARNSIAPIILNLFNRGIDFVFAFVMLRILGPEDAGIYYYAIVIFVWFDIFTNFGLDVFLIRETSRQRDKAGFYFRNTTYFRIFLMFACIPLVLGFFFVRQSALADPLPARGLLAIGLLYIGLAPGSISKGMTSLFYAFEKAEYPAAVTTITTINKAVLGLAALLLGYGIVGLAAASIITNIATLVILLWVGRRLLFAKNGDHDDVPNGNAATSYKPDRSLIRGMIGESWPLMLNHFLATIFFQIDIVILEALKGARIVGKYSVSYRWLLAINIIPAFFTQALLPVMSRQANEDREALKRTYSLGIKLLVSIAIPTAILFTFLADGLTLVLGGAEYMPEGSIALQIMIWSIPLGWVNSLTQYTLIAVDLQRKITRAFVIAVTFNIVSNVLLIPQYGYKAAAVTTIFSEMVLFIPFAILLQRALGKLAWLDMVWRSVVAGSVMAGVMVAGWSAAPGMLFFIAPAIYTGVFIALKPLNAKERDMLRPLLPGRFKRLTESTP
jgi:O-antigen/teichoic acid export membrane protein